MKAARLPTRLSVVRERPPLRENATLAETVRLALGMSAVCGFASIGVLHLYGFLPASWHVGGSVAAVLILGVVIAWQDE